MDNTNYVYLNYFIDSGYKMGLGWAEANVEEVNNFQVESCLFWKSLGFKIRELVDKE